MNFLAHLYLSGNSEKIKVGNFIADFVKGKQYLNFDDDIVKGIQLHRAIDDFTDTHHIVKDASALLKPDFGRYASVIIDVFYDHFLAINWKIFTQVNLTDFAEDSYQTLEKHEDILPQRVQNFLPSMQKDNWLVRYADFEGIERSLEGLSRRSKFASNLEKAVDNLERDYEQFNESFKLFFPEIINFTKEKINSDNFSMV